MDTNAFYDPLAEVYHLIYEDWEAAIERQGDVLASVIGGARTVADVACGIGTQSIGLAVRGFNVTGSDISKGAIARARREAAERKLSIDFRIDDMTRLSTYGDKSVDALIACDNAVPHLLSDEEIAAAFRQFHRVTKRGGCVVISVRDYATVPRERVRLLPYGFRQNTAVFQVWRWDGDQYDLNMYFVNDDGTRVETHVFRSRYYAVTIDTLIDLFRANGFTGVQRIDDRFFQPLIVATVG